MLHFPRAHRTTVSNILLAALSIRIHVIYKTPLSINISWFARGREHFPMRWWEVNESSLSRVASSRFSGCCVRVPTSRKTKLVIARATSLVGGAKCSSSCLVCVLGLRWRRTAWPVPAVAAATKHRPHKKKTVATNFRREDRSEAIGKSFCWRCGIQKRNSCLEEQEKVGVSYCVFLFVCLLLQDVYCFLCCKCFVSQLSSLTCRFFCATGYCVYRYLIAVSAVFCRGWRVFDCSCFAEGNCAWCASEKCYYRGLECKY